MQNIPNKDLMDKQIRSVSLDPNMRNPSIPFRMFSGFHRRNSDIKKPKIFNRQLSISTDEIQIISPKDAKLISETYNIQYACNQLIDKEERIIAYTNIKDDLKNSISFDEIALVSPIHQSLCIGKRHCYRIMSKSDQDKPKMIVFRCKNQKERDYWMKEIRCMLQNVSDLSITEENSLKLCIQECRNLAVKNKYFCEVKLDEIIYARTSVKEMKDICFWGEEFDLTGLSGIKLISITLWRLPREKQRERQSQIVSHVNISIDNVNRHCVTEKWYSPSPVYFPNLKEIPSHSLIFSAACDVDSPPDIKQKDKRLSNQVIDSAPLLRIKSQYLPLKVLDPKFYSELLDFLEKKGVELFRALDVNLKAKYREELILPMVQLAIRKQWIDEFLSELILKESINCDINIILRGNSMASKAIECFLKVECGDYLKEILGDLIKDIMKNHNDLEIDHVRLLKMKVSVSANAIRKRTRRLEKMVDQVLGKIFHSIIIIPRRVLMVFNKIRLKLRSFETNNSGFTEKVVSACFFLRLVCPAILTPYLFQLVPDYSQNPDINRSFTLVAKCVQNVANFAGIDDQKESYMQTMVLFCRDYYNQMHNFLEKITIYHGDSNYESSDRKQWPNYDQIGFGMEMARLCYHIEYCLSTFSNENSKELENEAKHLISQLRIVEKEQLNVTDIIERICASKEDTKSGNPIQNTIEPSSYFSMHDLPISGSSNRLTVSAVPPCLQRKLQSSKIPRSPLSVPSFNLKADNYNYEDLLSLRKIIKLEKDRLQLMKEVMTQYPFDSKSKPSAPDLLHLNLDNADLIASSNTNLQSYIEFATQCLNNVEQSPDNDTSNSRLEKIIKMNSSLQIILVKYSKDCHK